MYKKNVYENVYRIRNISYDNVSDKTAMKYREEMARVSYRTAFYGTAINSTIAIDNSLSYGEASHSAGPFVFWIIY